MKKRILGIDTGTNSLGWAVVDRNDDGVYSLINKGSLIFQEGVKVEKGIESSKAAELWFDVEMRKVLVNGEFGYFMTASIRR